MLSRYNVCVIRHKGFIIVPQNKIGVTSFTLHDTIRVNAVDNITIYSPLLGISGISMHIHVIVDSVSTTFIHHFFLRE